VQDHGYCRIWTPIRARAAVPRVGGLDPVRASFEDATQDRQNTHLTDVTSMALVAADGIRGGHRCTGHPAAGIAHALVLCENGQALSVMLNRGADVAAGPLLAERAAAGRNCLFAWPMATSLP